MKEICSDGCSYSKAMNQPYPRLCINCGQSEESAIDHERINARNTREFTISNLAQLIQLIEHRNIVIQSRNNSRINSDVDYDGLIDIVNEKIKKVLNLT
jgi:hypothetical protein